MTDQYRKDFDDITDDLSRLNNWMGCQGRDVQRVIQLLWDVELRGGFDIKSNRSYEYQQCRDDIQELGHQLIALGKRCVKLDEDMGDKIND
jgi:hypothetical protein